MEPYTISSHCSRMGNPQHNDREMLRGFQDSHIDISREKDNMYISYKGLPFSEAEKAYYKEHYSAWLKAQNENYIRNRHKEKVLTTDQLLTRKYTRPEEVILQIGNKDHFADSETFKACVSDYLKEMEAYSSNCHILDVAIHLDEATPHCHIRRVWDYIDENGNPHISQNQALKALGFAPPDPALPPYLRKNNAKISFDRHMRERWKEICISHGLIIAPKKKKEIAHSQPAQYKIMQQESQIAANEEILLRQRRESEILKEETFKQEQQLKLLVGLEKTVAFLEENKIDDLIGAKEELYELQKNLQEH